MCRERVFLGTAPNDGCPPSRHPEDHQGGMLRMPYWTGDLGFSSVLACRPFNLSLNSCRSHQTIGATMGAGPHHGAQKSTSTGTIRLLSHILLEGKHR